jgi:iron complex outermembrane receptor protein
VFSGFQPSNRADEDRSAVGAYIDVEANLTEKLLVSGALRVENYSDFGDSFTGKVSARYDFNDGFALRGTASTGFRAPSLQQNFFSSVATNLTAAGLVEVGTFRTSSNVARALGGKPLEAEESENYSIGAVARAGNFSLTADMYLIKINDRIVLTENLTGGLVTTALTGAGITNVSSARFFINGVDTETTGLDVVARYKLATDNVGDFDFTFSGNLNNTYITRLPPRFGGVLPLFDGQNQINFEDGQPAEKFSTTVDWSKGALGATYRLNYYGAITDPGLAQNGSQSFLVGENVLVDLEGRVSFDNGLKFAVGAENVFDAYPDATPAAFNATGALGFSRFSPYGFNGRMVYARASFSW